MPLPLIPIAIGGLAGAGLGAALGPDEEPLWKRMLVGGALGATAGLGIGAAGGAGAGAGASTVGASTAAKTGTVAAGGANAASTIPAAVANPLAAAPAPAGGIGASMNALTAPTAPSMLSSGTVPAAVANPAAAPGWTAAAAPGAPGWAATAAPSAPGWVAPVADPAAHSSVTLGAAQAPTYVPPAPSSAPGVTDYLTGAAGPEWSMYSGPGAETLGKVGTMIADNPMIAGTMGIGAGALLLPGGESGGKQWGKGTYDEKPGYWKDEKYRRSSVPRYGIGRRNFS